MSEKHEQEVETIFSARDLVSKTVERIVGAGERINHVFDHASHVLGSFASITAAVAGGFGIERSIEGVKEHFESVKSLADITGIATEKADAMTEVFAKFGITGESTERIMLGMSKKAIAMEKTLQAAGGAGGAGSLFSKLGVDIRKGPTEALVKLSEKFKDGKVDTVQLATALGVPLKRVTDLNDVLEAGPKHLRAMLAEAEKMGIRDDQMQSFVRMTRAQDAIAAAWRRITVIVGAQLMPVISDLLTAGARKMEGWVERAKEFGKTMSSFLREHYRMVVNIGKVMLANYSLQKLTGAGIGGNVAGGLGKIMKFVGGGALKNGSLLSAPRALQLTAGPLEKIMMFMGRLGPLAGVLARFTLVGAIVAVIVGAFLAIKNNVYGIRDRLVELWDRIMLRFAGIKLALAPLFDLFSSNGVVGKFLGQTISVVFRALGDVVDGLMKTMHILIHVFSIIAQDGMSALTKPVLLWQTAANAARADMAVAARLERERKARDAAAEAAANRGAPETRDRQPYFDFRGSKFDIKQAFSDVDPDRIAVAFANDLAGMGERRVQSNAAPLWAV